MKILYVIAQKDFRDEEYFIPKKIFEDNKIIVETTSIKKEEAIGILGGTTKINIELKDANMNNYNAIVIAGGKGALTLDENDDLKRLLYDAMKEDKTIAAICISPLILANFGLLRKKVATVWDNNGQQASILKRQGAIYCKESVVIDKNIITANGPNAAEEFAKSIIDNLKK
jgi:protease I